MRVGLTQTALAHLAGYSDRLIRKAEANGTLNFETFHDIVVALQESGSDVVVADFVHDPVQIATEFVRAFEDHGRAMLAHCGHLLSEAFVFECAGDPISDPIAGVFLGSAGMQEWLDRFLGIFTRAQDKPLIPEFYVKQNQVIARYFENVEFMGKRCPPIWVNLYFSIQDGQIDCIRDEYDTLTGTQFLADCGV